MNRHGARWVLRYRGGRPPAEDVARIRAAEGVRVLEVELPTVLLTGGEDDLRRLARDLPGWTLVPERFTPPA